MLRIISSVRSGPSVTTSMPPPRSIHASLAAVKAARSRTSIALRILTSATVGGRGLLHTRRVPGAPEVLPLVPGTRSVAGRGALPASAPGRRVHGGDERGGTGPAPHFGRARLL